MFKIGDKVIISKKISNIKDVSGVISRVTEIFYGVKHNYNRDVYYNNYCNVFINHTGEKIELDLQEIRNDRLKSLFNE